MLRVHLVRWLLVTALTMLLTSFEARAQLSTTTDAPSTMTTMNMPTTTTPELPSTTTVDPATITTTTTADPATVATTTTTATSVPITAEPTTLSPAANNGTNNGSTCIPPPSLADRNWTIDYCPDPVLGNITQPPFVNGSWSINKYNKTWKIHWYTEYNQSIDGVGNCSNVTNPQNYFERSCNWTLACNIPNVTNGSVTFFNLTVNLTSPPFLTPPQVILEMNFTQDDPVLGPTRMFTFSRAVYKILTPGATAHLVFPNKNLLIPDVPLGTGYTLTSNWRQNLTVSARFYTPNQTGGWPFQPFLGMNTSMHFECDQYIVNVTVYTDPDYAGLGFTLGIPLALIALIILLGCLKYKYPNLCACGKKSKDGNENFDDDEKLLAAARAKREGRTLAQPMLEIKDRGGMQTWLDQANDVVEDLNKNCLYLEEAKPDSQVNQFDALESGDGARPAMSSHKDGFIGGRQLYAVGGASGGAKVVDHRPTLQKRGGRSDDVEDVAL